MVHLSVEAAGCELINSCSPLADGALMDCVSVSSALARTPATRVFDFPVFVVRSHEPKRSGQEVGCHSNGQVRFGLI